MMSGELSESNQVNFSNNCWNRINIGAELFIKTYFSRAEFWLTKDRDECCCTEKLLLIYSLKTSNNISPGFLKLSLKSSMEKINHENLI